MTEDSSRVDLLFRVGSRRLRASVGALAESLSAQARAARDGEGRPESVYVWWGPGPLCNRLGVLALRAFLEPLEEQVDSGNPLLLYLTDGRSLYAGALAEVSWDDESWRDSLSCPAGPTGERFPSDCYYRLVDLREIVVEDGAAVRDYVGVWRTTDGGEVWPLLTRGGVREVMAVVVERSRSELGAPPTSAAGEFALWAEGILVAQS